MMIKLTKDEVCKIIGEHFETILKASGGKVIGVSSKYDGFEIECGEPEPDEDHTPRSIPRPLGQTDNEPI